jgi:hypothetical protein
LSKYQKLAALFSFLSAVSIMFGQLTRTALAYAPLVAFAACIVFIVLASINAYKAYYENSER